MNSKDDEWFNQGNSKISLLGKKLHSGGFYLCSAFILQKIDGLEAYGAHITGFRGFKTGPAGFNKQQEEVAYNLPPGSYVGRLIKGTYSRDINESIVENHKFLEKFCQEKEISFLPDIRFNSGDRHWVLEYKPDTHILRVYTLRKGLA